MRETRRLLAGLIAGMALLASCTQPQPAPGPTTPTPSATPTPERPFTVTTTEVPGSFDPAATISGADAMVTLNAFSRLMVVHPAQAELKPDLARDCLYTSPTTYQCDLPTGLRFHNGHALTASDVKFSIERAYLLNVPTSSISLLDSLDRVEVIDDQTVAFHLKYADTQFGYALATPSAGIVDEELYDPDAVRPNEGQVVGSGPYEFVTSAPDHLVFRRFEDYEGALTGAIDEIHISFVADSSAAEQAINEGTTDVVWHSLNEPAVGRVRHDMAAHGGRTTEGFTEVPLAPTRVQRLILPPDSPVREDAALRAALSAAVQPDRTLRSVIPVGVPGQVDAFPAGGEPEIPDLGAQRRQLTLGYATQIPDQRDLANLIRGRIEERAGMSLQLVPDSREADIVLTDRAGWVNTAFGWLQPYTDAALPGSQAKVDQLLQDARATTDPETRAVLLAEIQAQAAVDQTVIPLSQGAHVMFLGEGVTLAGQPFGPTWQLGLWSFRT